MAGRHQAPKNVFKSAWFIFASPMVGLALTLGGVAGIQSISSAQAPPVLEVASAPETIDLVVHYQNSPSISTHQEEMEAQLANLDNIETAAFLTPDLEALSQVKGEAQKALSSVQDTLTTSYKVEGVSLEDYEKYQKGEIGLKEVIYSSKGMSKVEEAPEEEGAPSTEEVEEPGLPHQQGTPVVAAAANEVEIEVKVPVKKEEETLQTLAALSQGLQEAQSSLSPIDHVALGDFNRVQELTDEEFKVYSQNVSSPSVTEETLRRISIQPSGLVGQTNGYIEPYLMTPLSWSPNSQLHWGAARMLELLNADFKAEMGYDLKITSAYRSYSEQQEAKNASGRFAAYPGQSNHGLGLAIDIGSNQTTFIDFNTVEHQWLMENGHRYGWLHPTWAGPSGELPEPWHFEFGTYYSGEYPGFRNEGTPPYSVNWATSAQPKA